MPNTDQSWCRGSEKTRRENRRNGREMARVMAADPSAVLNWSGVSNARPSGSAKATIPSVIALPAMADRMLTSFTAPNGAATILARARAQA